MFEVNVAIVTLGVYPLTVGGVEVHTFKQALGLAARHHSIQILTKGQNRSSSNVMVDGVHIRALGPNIPVLGQLLFVIGATLALFRERGKVDIVHVHYATYFLLPAYFFNLLTGKPFVVTCHGYDVIFLGRNSIWRLVQRVILSRASGISVPSVELREILVDSYGLSAKKVALVPNGVDMGEIEKTKAIPVPRNHPRAVLVANLRPVKDPLTAIKAFEIVSNQVENAHLVVVGDGSLRKEAQSYLKEHKLDGIVTLKGELSHPAALLEIWRSDCLVLSSISEGGNPLVVLEAMALGKPVVATAVGGVRDIITDHIDGLLAPPSSPDILAKLIAEVLSSPELARSISEKARAKVEAYTWEKSITMYERIYFRATQPHHVSSHFNNP